MTYGIKLSEWKEVTFNLNYYFFNLNTYISTYQLDNLENN